jgi:lactose/cellobiose-specific phosphotransferase system IIC component
MLKRVHLWLVAIRDSFITLLPVTFFGVVAILIKDFPLPGYQALMVESWGGGWQEQVQGIIDATHGMFSVLLSALVSLHVAARLRRPDSEELPLFMVSLFGLINFMIVAVSLGELTPNSLGHASSFIAIGVGIFSAETICWAVGIRWMNPLQMPYDTEVVFYHAIRLVTPFIVIWLAFALVVFGLGLLPEIDAKPWQDLVEMALQNGTGVWWMSSIAALSNQIVWFSGAHGGHFIDTYAQWLFSPLGTAYDANYAWRPMFDAFVLLGGAGATLGLLLAIAITVRDGPARKVANLSILPGIFNINETILYGLPIVLNPIYLVPFILLPLLLALLTTASVSLGFLQFLPTTVPWTTPPVISGWLLTGSWRGAAFQIFEICLSAAFYLPFVRKAEAARIDMMSRKLVETTDAILSEGGTRAPIVWRQDQISHMARGLLSDLRIDLANDTLKLAYQPKHTLDGEIIGVEALLRWPHRRYGHLEPAIAIALVEQSGDIHALGYWVLEQACACKARWNAQGFTRIGMAVNISPLQMGSEEFVPRLSRTLKKHGLRPDEIELEITESLYLPNTLAVDATLHDLSELGVRLAMDDFGMGYSSLLHLRRFHVHTIKIDGSLTREILSNTATADIIRTIAELGRAQNIDVIAEYVETKAQRDLLGSFGCGCFQGDFYSPALGEPECLEYFKAHCQDQIGSADDDSD